MFFDSLIRCVYCECRQPFSARKKQECDWWLDIMLPSYRSVQSKDKAVVFLGTNTSKMGFNTAREMLSEREQGIVQDFIDRTYVADIADAKEKFRELFTDCQLSALNEIHEPKFKKEYETID